MKVTLVASTSVDPLLLATSSSDDPPWSPQLEGYRCHPRTPFDCVADADELAEFAGRACYQSWNRPNPKTATNEGYLANILDHEHFSVLEHASATFYIEGVSRSLTHELIRHRHLSFSQLSQRYVDESESEMVKPPAVSEVDNLGGELSRKFYQATESAIHTYNHLVSCIEGAGFSRKQAREAARSVLPNATETKIVVTGNMRTWREVLLKRGSQHADAEIRQLALKLFEELKSIAPNSFQDLETTEVSGVLTIKRKGN